MLSSLLAALTLASGALAALSNPEKVAALRTAALQNDRIKILDQDTDFTFDFFNNTPTKGGAGSTVGATAANFPALVGSGIAMTLGQLDGCGMNTPHTHPRATEILYVINGTLTSGFIAENGARLVFNELHEGVAAVFPQGSIHYQQNELCEPVTFIAALSNEDPGVLSVAQRFFGLPSDVTAAALDLGIEYVEGIEKMIPDNIALGREECLKRCGLKREGQPTAQQQPPKSTPPVSHWPSSKTMTYQATATHQTRNAVQQTSVFGALASDGETIASNGVPKSVLIALSVVIGAMALGYVVIGVFWFVGRRRREAEKANRWYVRPEMSGRSLVPTDEKYDGAQ